MTEAESQPFQNIVNANETLPGGIGARIGALGNRAIDALRGDGRLKRTLAAVVVGGLALAPSGGAEMASADASGPGSDLRLTVRCDPEGAAIVTHQGPEYIYSARLELTGPTGVNLGTKEVATGPGEGATEYITDVAAGTQTDAGEPKYPFSKYARTGNKVTAFVDDALRLSDLASIHLRPPVASPSVDINCPPPTTGYRLFGQEGSVDSFGNATDAGSLAGQTLAKPIVGGANTASGDGYELFASDGEVFTLGDSISYGSLDHTPINKPIVGGVETATGKGYWLVASDGGVFSYGDAGFQGSAGNIALNKPVVGMARTSTGNGYWLVASDGGVFSYGDAKFKGSTGGITLDQPIAGIASTPEGNGYWLAARDGGIFSFGGAEYLGNSKGRGRVIIGIGATASTASRTA